MHAYTATQGIVDGPVRGGHDYRKGRAAAVNTVPETTGAAISVARAIPELKGKFDGVSFRVPNITGSISDITFLAKRKTTVEEINQDIDRCRRVAALAGDIESDDRSARFVGHYR